MGGQAKWRKAEIEELKRQSPEEAAVWRQMQNDKRSVAFGINPESLDIAVPAAMARALSALFNEAKRTGDIDPPVTLLYTTINATVRGLSDVPVACKKGCSHCCYTWVSVTAPEALSIAKIIKRRGDATIEKIRLAYQQTKDYDFDARTQHPLPCPLLEEDLCSIYDARPKVCRLAASGDAEICARTFHNITDENLPMPVMHVTARGAYAIVMTAALRHAGLPYHAYEFNAALTRALETVSFRQACMGLKTRPPDYRVADGTSPEPAPLRGITTCGLPPLLEEGAGRKPLSPKARCIMRSSVVGRPEPFGAHVVVRDSALAFQALPQGGGVLDRSRRGVLRSDGAGPTEELIHFLPVGCAAQIQHPLAVDAVGEEGVLQ